MADASLIVPFKFFACKKDILSQTLFILSVVKLEVYWFVIVPELNDDFSKL